MGFQTPGAIDLHVHLREPGANTAETIESGTRAALLGGFVLVADMPNNPGTPVHTPDALTAKHEISERDAWIPTTFYAGSQPESYVSGRLTAMAPHAAGVKFYATETTGNANEYEAKDFAPAIDEWHDTTQKPFMLHAGEHNLEDFIGYIAQDRGHALHVCHVNSVSDVQTVQAAKRKGLPVTSGVTPHHILKTSHDVHTQGVFAEMKPPLVRQDEAEQLMALLARGEIDVVETDFAPHALGDKYEAEHTGGKCFGVPGIEHVLPLLFYQVSRGRISEQRLFDATFVRPGVILDVKFDTNTEVWWNDDAGAYRIGEDDVEAKCGWTPYMGMLAIGKVDMVRIGGTIVVSDGRPLRKRPEVIEKRGHQVF